MFKFRLSAKSSPVKPRVYAALCTGIADGSIEQYSRGEKHAILAMVKAHESEADERIRMLLSKYGWSSPEVTQLKLLDDPFSSADSDMLQCYEGATEKDGGIIVYSDPILDEDYGT